MLATIASILTVIGGIVIAYLKWRSSQARNSENEAKQNAEQAKSNAGTAVSTVFDTIKQLRSRAKRKRD